MSQAALDRHAELGSALLTNHGTDKRFEHLAILTEYVGGGQSLMRKIAQQAQVAPTDVVGEIGRLLREPTFNFVAVMEFVSIINGHQKYLVSEIGSHLHQLRDFFDTRRAPVGPEVEENNAPVEIRESELRTRSVLFEGRRARGTPVQSKGRQQ